MNKNSLFSMQGSVMLGVNIDDLYNITDLIRAKKVMAGVVVDLSYDFNGNGVVDDDDIATLRSILISA